MSAFQNRVSVAQLCNDAIAHEPLLFTKLGHAEGACAVPVALRRCKGTITGGKVPDK